MKIKKEELIEYFVPVFEIENPSNKERFRLEDKLKSFFIRDNKILTSKQIVLINNFTFIKEPLGYKVDAKVIYL